MHLCEDDPRAKIFVGNLDWETKEGIYNTFDRYLEGNNNHHHNNINNKCKQTNKPIQGVELRLIQVPMQLNFSLWRPNPEN